MKTRVKSEEWRVKSMKFAYSPLYTLNSPLFIFMLYSNKQKDGIARGTMV